MATFNDPDIQRAWELAESLGYRRGLFRGFMGGVIVAALCLVVVAAIQEFGR